MGQLWSDAAPMRPRPAPPGRPTKLAPTVQQVRPLQFDGMQTTGEAFDRAVEQLVLVPGREAAGFLSLDSPVLQAMLSGDVTELGSKLEVRAPDFDPEDKTLADLLTITSAVLSCWVPRGTRTSPAYEYYSWRKTRVGGVSCCPRRPRPPRISTCK